MTGMSATDTSPEARIRMQAVLRAKSPAERLAILDAMWRSASKMIRQSVRRCHSEWDESQVAHETARRLSHGAF